jgi:serine/threonine protein phosphatase PrpC
MTRLSQQILVNGSGNTHVGRVRSSNQDSYLCDNKRSLYIVADGMGGHAGGEVASSLAVQNIRAFLDSNLVPAVANNPELPSGATAKILSDSINHASARIYDRALEEPNLKGMGTTATVARTIGRSLVVAHVGDSRLYLIRCGYIYQITTDHSLVSEQLRAGIITKEEAENHHLRNVITRSVGYQEQEDVDTYVLDLEPNDFIVICSDGLHGRVPEETICEHCKNYGILAVDHLIAEANNRGGDDNISVIVCQVKV